MLKRLTDRITAAVRGDTNPNVQTLTSMGFSPEAATTALEQSNHDVDRAVELLLAQQHHQQQQQQNLHQPQHVHYDQQEADLQRAIEESRRMEEQRYHQQQQCPSAPTMTRTAAMNRAAEAALQRAENNQKKMTVKKAPVNKAHATAAKTTTSAGVGTNHASVTPPVTGTLTAHHPGVKLIPKLTDKSKEEQILRCADRVKSYPLAVDTLYKALTAVQKSPESAKFRRIDKTTAGYQRSIASAPGAESFLLAMNFHPEYQSNSNSQYLVMDYPMYDPALLYLGTSALEQTKLTAEYKMEKQKLDFYKEMTQIRTTTTTGSSLTDSEATKRAAYWQKCPAEPPFGRGALIQIKLFEQETIRRRFDGDDTLADVLNWLGGHGSVIVDKIVQTREWSLIDKNRYPVLPIDCSISSSNKTLQSIGCWPSGLLEIVPSTEEWKHGDATATAEKPGSYRGLGAPPREDAI